MQSAPKAHTLSMWLPMSVMTAATKPVTATKPATKPVTATKPATKPSGIWMKDEPSVVVVPCFLSKEEREYRAMIERRHNFFGRDYS